jgi:hypothetical protein
MIITGGLLKMSQIVTVLLFPFTFMSISIIENSEDKVGPTLSLRLIIVCFQKAGLPYSRVGAGAGAGTASKF